MKRANASHPLPIGVGRSTRAYGLDDDDGGCAYPWQNFLTKRRFSGEV